MLSDSAMQMKKLPELGLNAPYGARCFLTAPDQTIPRSRRTSLNAPYGARCFLTTVVRCRNLTRELGLNAPYGARCFLTPRLLADGLLRLRLNAPYGARCFLTRSQTYICRHAYPTGRNAPYGARCFLTRSRQTGTIYSVTS